MICDDHPSLLNIYGKEHHDGSANTFSKEDFDGETLINLNCGTGSVIADLIGVGIPSEPVICADVIKWEREYIDWSPKFKDGCFVGNAQENLQQFLFEFTPIVDLPADDANSQCISENIIAGRSAVSATWDCECRGKQSCQFPIIFEGNKDLNIQEPDVAPTTTNPHLDKFLYYKRDFFNNMRYSESCWNHLIDTTRNYADGVKPTMVLLAKCTVPLVEFGGKTYTQEDFAGFVVIFDLISCVIKMLFGKALKRLQEF